MNLNNICKGLVIKNYLELCKLLEIKPITTGGNAKKSQLKEFERYFKYSKKGNKFIIEEVYTEPKEKIDKRTETIYGQYIEKLILDLLVIQQEENKKYIVNFSTNKIFEALNMINKNYSYCLENKHKLAIYLDIDKQYVKEFYNITYSKLTNVLESALRRLTNKMLIHWNKVITISINEDIGNGFIKEVHYIADDFETNYIVSIEKKVANEMGLNTKRDVIIRDKLKEFNTKVIEILKKKDKNINYYYRSYKIFFNEYIKKEKNVLELLLKGAEKAEAQEQLNQTIAENYKQDNKIRHDNYLEERKGLGTPKYLSEKIKISEDYIKNNDLLVDTVINSNTKDITNDIANKYREKEKEDAELMEFFEGL